MIIPSIVELKAFDPARFCAQTLAQTSHSKTMLVSLEPGQSIPVHHPGIDLTLVILEGHATLVAGEEEFKQAGAGAVIIAHAGQARGIRADTRTVALVIVSPPPTAQDHREVAEHLSKGTWR